MWKALIVCKQGSVVKDVGPVLSFRCRPVERRTLSLLISSPLKGEEFTFASAVSWPAPAQIPGIVFRKVFSELPFGKFFFPVLFNASVVEV